MYNRILKCKNEIRKHTDFKPELGLVLGSGLGAFTGKMKIECEIPYDQIDGFPRSTVQGHKGSFVFGYVNQCPIVVMSGRVHYYEGYEMSEVVLPIRVMGLLGIKTLILTNAAGGIDETMHPGDLMMIKDHISVLTPNPLRGANIDELGTRFPDMSHVYDENIQQKIRETAHRLNIPLKEGVYVQTVGPSYETPAEIRMLRQWGADAVGMSTVCEAIAAKHMGIQIGAISCITNMAAGILNQPLDHNEVRETANKVEQNFTRLVWEAIAVR